MRILHNQNGYTLFLTVLIILLFSILAISLITLTISGAKKSSAREEVTQASELADKGVQHITQQINKELEDALGENGLPRDEFMNELIRILRQYECDTGNLTSLEKNTGDYKVCIENIGKTFDENGNENELRKLVSFRSIGDANNRTKQIVADVEIGAATAPDALKYALGVHKTCSGRNCIPGEGNLFLHGASSVEGDIKVDGNIITTHRGYVVLNGERWVESHLPSAMPGPETKTSKLVLGGDIYTFTNNPSYNYHIQQQNFTNGYTKQKDVNKAFTHAPQLVVREPKREKINITDQKDNFYYSKHSADSIVNKSEFNEGNTYKDKKVFANEQKCIKFASSFRCEKYGQIFNGNNTFDRFVTDNNLHIKNAGNVFRKTTIKKGMFVGGDLIIGNESDSYYPSNYDKIQIDGPIFVHGDLSIKGADAQLNSLIYVKGKVDIQNTRINGLHVNGKEGSLIIFANGQINIKNNSVRQDEPSNIRGYFYSEDALEMFGVGSNLRIEGGISAKRVVLNAIRGRARDKSFTGSQRITTNYYFEGKSNQLNYPSRLQIIYNPDIINTYSDLKQQEPVIYNVDPPKLKSRH